MADANGSGRMDRVEAALDRLTERFEAMVEHHDREFKSLMTWQVLTQDQVRETQHQVQETSKFVRELGARMDELGARTDERINKLVSSIGALITRIPPENLPG